MRSLHLPVRLSALFMMGTSAMACGNDPATADPSQLLQGYDAGTFCASYCETIVQDGQGCEGYNSGGRCSELCSFYGSGPCRQDYTAFADCVTSAAQISCQQPDSGHPTLILAGCQDKFAAWNECSVTRDAGVCRY